MDYIGFDGSDSLFGKDYNKKLKDKGQRKECGCIFAKDIGQYNTCPHSCIYCYANTSIKTAIKNYGNSLKDTNQETILI